MTRMIPQTDAHPALLTRDSSPALSDRYVHVQTSEVVDAMVSEGFTLASVQAPTPRTRNPQFVKHMLDFRHPDLGSVDGAVPRVLFTNSHDGSTSASFMMGVFRFVCSNGMVVGSTYAKEIVRHSGEAARDLIERVRALSRNTGPMFAQIDQWTRKELTSHEEHEFASMAAVLRFGDAQRFDPAQLLQLQRGDDEGRSLWRVFNRVQENATRGGLLGHSAAGRPVHSRAIRSVDQNTTFNAQLWRLAAEFAE